MTTIPGGVETTASADPRRWQALGVIGIAQLMVVLDASIVTIALPSIQGALKISTPDRQWVMTAYMLAFGGLLLLGGRIADYMGRKRVFVIGLVGFAAASALGGAAQSSGMLYAARALQGLFGALMAPASLSLLTVTFTEARERAKAFAVYGGIAGGGAAIGLIAGGVLTEYASWRWCLFVNVPISIGAAVAALRVITESRVPGKTKYDIPGAVLVTGGLVALVYGLTEAASDGWSSTEAVVPLVIAVVALVAFVLVELRVKAPLLPVRVVLDRNRGGSFAASFLAGLGMFGMFLFLTYYFQGTLQYSALKAGFAFLPFSGGIIVAAGAASKLLPRVGPRPMMTVGFIASALGTFWLTRLGIHSAYVTGVLPSEVVMSVGLGIVFVPLSSTSLIGVDPHDAGVASALLNATQQVGASLGTALLNTIFASALASYLVAHAHQPTATQLGHVHGYSVAYWVSGTVLLVSAAVSFLLIRASRHELATADFQPALTDAA